jgi:hypothetical protein
MRSIVLCFLVAAAGCSSSHGVSDIRDGGAIPDAALSPDAAQPPIDAGRIVAEDAGHVPPDAGAPPAGGRIACGTTECDAATEGCLASCLYATDERMPACVAMDADRRWPAAECPTGREQFPRYWLTCDGDEDCPATERCHLQYGSLGQYTYCDTCEPPSCDIRYFNPLCRSDADCPLEVPRCLPDTDLPGYSICQDAT